MCIRDRYNGRDCSFCGTRRLRWFLCCLSTSCTARRTASQLTDPLATCPSVTVSLESCVIFIDILVGVFIGFLTPKVGKKPIACLSLILGTITVVLIAFLYAAQTPFGLAWYAASSLLSCTIYTGMTVQMSIFATDFAEREKVFGAGSFIGSTSSLIVYFIYAVTRLDDFSTIAFFIIGNGLMGIILILRMKLSIFNEGSVNKL
eukprot:TRINITY_DN2463_c0_g2_i7.p1 TRINITY_DN2463_c0_g2~~TRINITY_DN2463_c0_g2_i7.p1  ORF type:complete len:204 (-),score=14.58 TRINITY_DN2463_c0_g2_i7:105-716(-)